MVLTSGKQERGFSIVGIRPDAWLWSIVLMLTLSAITGIASAQVKIQKEELKPVVEAKADDDRTEESAVKKNEEKYAGGAALKTDSDLEDQLKKAATFVAEKNYRYATILWDRVLEGSENSLVTRDGETYISLVRQVEETIRNLPPNGLQVYRISADGKAKALMPGNPAEADDQSLSKLVRLYFLSSVGDEAAFELGCRALDQRDFVSASRLFGKVLNEHPDPSIDKNQVLIRLAIATGNLGDQQAALQSLSAIVDGDPAAQRLAANARKHLEFLQQSNRIVTEAGDSVAMRLGGANRTGLMPDLPDDALDGDLTQGYEFRFPFVFPGASAEVDLGEVLRGGASGRKTDDPVINSLSQKWKSSKWFPTNQLLFADGRVVLKTTNDLVCIDSTGKSNLAIWHSLWLNHFELDEASWNAKTYGQQIRNRNGSPLPMDLPKDENESWYFFDRIHQSMSISGGVVFTIEGQNYSQLDDAIPRQRRTSNARNFNQPVNLARSRTNNLTAYDLRTGKVRWTRSAYEKPKPVNAEEEADDPSLNSKIGFLGTPVPFGNLVICPVTEGGAISIYAMDTTDQGKTVWKTFLCDDPTEGVDHFAPVEITVAGQDAYVTCGTGVLFSLNAATGNIQFARRYTRDGNKKKIQTSYNQYQQLLLAEGWDDNLVITWKNALVVMASDHDYLFAVDRRNGEFLWDAPRLPFDEETTHAYCLGHHDDKLVMATNKGILCYNLAGDGKLHWYQKFGGNSFGRGFITSRAVYVPVEDSIIQYDLETGKKLAQVAVNLGTESKVGNLMSDGSQIWVAGLNRVVALRSLRDRLEELDELVTGGSTDALKERLKIYSRLEEHEKALGDATQLFDLAEDKTAGYLQLIQNLKEEAIISSIPQSVLDYMDSLVANDAMRQLLKPTIAESYQAFFAAADASSEGNQARTVQMVLNWSSYDISEGFRSAVTKFLTNHPPRASDIQKVIETAGENQRLMLVPVLAKVESATPILISLLGSPSNAVKVAVANELALLGNKSCVPAAFDLLSSDQAVQRIQAYLILRNVTGARIAFPVNGSLEERQVAIGKWKQWMDSNLESLKVKLPVKLRFGNIIVGTTSKILDFDLESGLTSKTELEGFNPEDVVTARNGNRIVVEYSRQRIIELDLAGKELVKISTSAFPRSARKLPNGNYLVAWRNQTQPVVELDAKGRTVWSTENISGYALSAERLSNGNTLIAFEDRIVEIDPNSKIMYEVGRAQGVSSCKEARRLENGNTLVVHGTSVSVFDKNKNPVLRIRGSFRPKCAIQLADGRILVGHDTGLRVFDKEGTKVGDDFVNENVNSIWDY